MLNPGSHTLQMPIRGTLKILTPLFLQTLLQEELSRKVSKTQQCTAVYAFLLLSSGWQLWSLTQPDKSSDGNVRLPTVQTESPNWYQAQKGDTSKDFRLFWKHEHFPFSGLQSTVDCHHFNNFNSTAKMTCQVFLYQHYLKMGRGRRVPIECL